MLDGILKLEKNCWVRAVKTMVDNFGFNIDNWACPWQRRPNDSGFVRTIASLYCTKIYASIDQWVYQHRLRPNQPLDFPHQMDVINRLVPPSESNFQDYHHPDCPWAIAKVPFCCWWLNRNGTGTCARPSHGHTFTLGIIGVPMGRFKWWLATFSARLARGQVL